MTTKQVVDKVLARRMKEQIPFGRQSENEMTGTEQIVRGRGAKRKNKTEQIKRKTAGKKAAVTRKKNTVAKKAVKKKSRR